MGKTFLLEIGLEEMPAHVVSSASLQLKQRVSDYLTVQKLEFQDIQAYSTPRRLAVLVHELADQQPDENIAVKGPAKKIALDKEGHWSKAAQGFVRGQKMTTDDIYFQDVKGTEYVYVQKHIAGQSAVQVLQGLIEPIKAMTFPTRMRWNKFDFAYIRPIHWLVAMLDQQVIDLKLLNITANNQTRGHRFLGSNITLATAQDYQKALADDYVIVDAQERKNLIRQQIAALAAENNWQVDVDEDLLEEVNNLVEYPTAFAGKFSEKYLEMPEEVLITSMKDNQRYFYVRKKDGSLAPNFIAVRNGNQEYLENVIAGNEKVLVARLDDAAFFFAEDQKHDLNYYVRQLQHVTFHDKIGSMSEKMARTKVIADLLAQKLQLSSSNTAAVLRAAEIYKFDLVTDMVGEFAELQGVMGEKYALLMGEKTAVAQAIREHYLPNSAEGQLPQSLVGSVLAVADKLESIMSFFAVDLIPNGSNDPYGLRRQALGIIRILEQRNWQLNLHQLQNEIVAAYQKQFSTLKFDYFKHQAEVDEFLIDRIRQLFSQDQVAHDLIDTVVALPSLDPTAMQQLVQVISHHQTDSNFKGTIEALTRVLRITQKASLKDSNDLAVDPQLFQTGSEKQLYQAVQACQADFKDSDFEQKYQALAHLESVITDYFTVNMVMDPNPEIRNNRLHQLQQLATLIKQLGDLNQLIVK